MMTEEEMNQKFLNKVRNENLKRLRNSLIEEMKRRHMSVPSFTDNLDTDSLARAIHTQELRDNITKIRNDKFSDNPLVADVSTIKITHITEIETSISILASKPRVGYDSGCTGGCMGL